MNTKLTIGAICALAALTMSGSAAALSLGPVSGATVIGRPLELSAPIRFDDLARGTDTGCMSAEVLYGDKLIDSSKIQLSVTPDSAQQTLIARISSATVVDEPVVTLVLRAGCGRQSTRRYVLLADAPKDEPVVLSAAASLSPFVRLEPSATAAATPPARANAAPRAVKTVVAKSRPVRERAMATVARSERNQPAPGRLQLGLWEPGVDKAPWLRVSGQLGATPSADSAHRAAASALWQALNAQPQDLLRTADRLRTLEGEMNSLRTLATRHRTEIASARETLQNAQVQRYTNLAIAGFLALLAGGAAAFFWDRSRRANTAASYASWYPPIEPHAEPEVQEEVQPAFATRKETLEPVAAPAESPVKTPALAQKAAPETVEPLLEFTLPGAAKVAPAAEHVEEPRPGMKAEALHGAQQQSEFFASLGQFDEAIAVLTRHIDESSEKPVLAFLELFRIYHALGMRPEYEELQSRFRQQFGVDTQSFTEFKDDRRELEMFPIAMARVAASWPSQEGQDIIEELLFRKPATPRELLSLEAYRELLWLYSLGQEIVHSTGMPAGLQLREDRGLPNNHFILPWAVGQEDEPSELSLDRLNAIDLASGSNAFGVDIDLTAGPGEALQQSWHDEPKENVPPKPQEPPAASDIFDAVMEAESRKLFR